MTDNADSPGSSFREKLLIAKGAAVQDARRRIESEVTAAANSAKAFQMNTDYKSSLAAASDRTPAEADSTQDISKSLGILPVAPSTNAYMGLLSARKRPAAQGRPSSLKEPAQLCRMVDGENAVRDLTPNSPRLAPPKKPMRGPRPVYQAIAVVETRSTQYSSKWYEEVNPSQKFTRKDLESLKSLYRLIQECLCTAQSGDNVDTALAKLRKKLHQAELFDFLSGILIKKSKLLEDDGLSMVFDDEVGIFPSDIKSDSWGLYRRWLCGQLDPHLLAGVESKIKTTVTGKSVKSRNLERGYQGGRSANCAGENELLNGQWWPLQICALRDGAHGEMEAGIHGQAGKGAYSIVMSGGGYSDVDNGDDITYCGTAGTNGTPSAGTILLKESQDLYSPVRVLRSFALPTSNRYRPIKGLRYDGLYNVVSFIVLDEETAMHAFRMTRREGQDPIRYQGAERRPTDEQLLEYANIRQLSSLGA